MKIIYLVLALALTGCASDKEYYAAETARHAAEAARWSAMGRIAEAGDTTVKTVAMVTMGVVGQGNAQVTAAPRSILDTLLQTANIFVPAVVHGYGIREQGRTSRDLSSNAARVSESTNSAFVGIASRIQAPAANISTMTTAAPAIPQANITTNIGGNGVIGSGSYNASPITSTTNTAESNNVTSLAPVSP